MSEITAEPDALSDFSPIPARRLRGNLGVASIVFMVVAAAAPLGVIGGVVPLGIAAGNGAGFPATFVVSTVILLLFAVGFTALTPYVEDAGAFFSYVRTSLGFPGIAYAIEDDAVSYVRTKARPASHSVADSAATDPFVLEAVGEIAAAATSSEAIVLAAADSIDRLVDDGRQHDADAVADVAVTVARA